MSYPGFCRVPETQKPMLIVALVFVILLSNVVLLDRPDLAERLLYVLLQSWTGRKDDYTPKGIASTIAQEVLLITHLLILLIDPLDCTDPVPCLWRFFIKYHGTGVGGHVETMIVEGLVGGNLRSKQR